MIVSASSAPEHVAVQEQNDVVAVGNVRHGVRRELAERVRRPRRGGDRR